MKVRCRSIFTEDINLPNMEVKKQLRNKFVKLLQTIKAKKLVKDDYEYIAVLRDRLKSGAENIETLLSKLQNPYPLFDNYFYLKSSSLDLLAYIFVVLQREEENNG